MEVFYVPLQGIKSSNIVTKKGFDKRIKAVPSSFTKSLLEKSIEFDVIPKYMNESLKYYNINLDNKNLNDFKSGLKYFNALYDSSDSNIPSKILKEGISFKPVNLPIIDTPKQ